MLKKVWLGESDWAIIGAALWARAEALDKLNKEADDPDPEIADYARMHRACAARLDVQLATGLIVDDEPVASRKAPPND